jgi:LysM repeat protein
LLQIANDLGVSVGEIMKANDLTDQNRLQVGQRLVIPVR